MFLSIQIAALLAVSLTLCSLFGKKWIAILLSFVIGLLITLQLVAVHTEGNFIDYKFLEHANIETIWSVKGFFLTEIIIFCLIALTSGSILYVISRWIRKRGIKNWIKGVVMVCGLSILFLPHGVFKNMYDVINLKTTKDKSFENALHDLGIDAATYVTSDGITAKPGNNIIVLSLESLERGFLEPPFEHLTPHLRSFAQQNTYIEMEQSQGSEWTSASMYTALTGLPAFFKSGSNEIFQASTSYLGANLGTVLNTAGYNMSYLIAKKEFSGMEDLLKTFHFDVKSERDFDQTYPKTNWGIADMDLFKEAVKEIKLQSSKDKPFALFLSTISGHFPDGVYDQRMEAFLPKQPTNLEFMTAAVDFYISQLLDFLQKEDLMENTTIFIFPDHQLMGNASPVLKKFQDPRGLYVITNAEKSKVLKNLHTPISQIDLPRIILNGAGVETNATFLTDYLGDKDKKTFLWNNQKNLLALNEAFLKRTLFNEGFTVSIHGQEEEIMLTSKTNGYKTIIPNIHENELYTMRFKANMEYIETKPIENNALAGFKVDKYFEHELINAFKNSSTPQLIFSISGDSLYGYFQKNNLFGIARAEKKKITFSKKDLAIYDNWKVTQTGATLNPDKLYLKSTGYNAYPGYGRSRIFAGWKPFLVTRGLNLLYIKDNRYVVENFDTYENPEVAKRFVEQLESLMDHQTDIVILVDDTASEELKPFKSKLRKLGFRKLSNLDFREAYIGYRIDGTINEKTSEKSIQMELDLRDLPPDPNIAKRSKEIDRFIAHAGGAILGDTYTNSLEALDRSYSKGFRLFELDIVKTADHKYVAAHDWNQWAEKTHYQGQLPPTHKVFMENPIKNYTPLDMERINHWFQMHKDAILVTDKVNNPEEFSSQFVDKNRLIMELFSEDALKQAVATGIYGPMVSENVLRSWKGNELQKLNELGVNLVAISRRMIVDNLALLKKLQEGGIKVYVFNVNAEKGKDEKYVVQNEMDYIYGLYADNWDFDQKSP